MALSVQCPSCGSFLDRTDRVCPACKARNPYWEADETQKLPFSLLFIKVFSYIQLAVCVVFGVPALFSEYFLAALFAILMSLFLFLLTRVVLSLYAKLQANTPPPSNAEKETKHHANGNRG